jgi:hypothetical protein
VWGRPTTDSRQALRLCLGEQARFDFGRWFNGHCHRFVPAEWLRTRELLLNDGAAAKHANSCRFRWLLTEGALIRRCLDAENPVEILVAVEHANQIDSIRKREIEQQCFFETIAHRNSAHTL